MSVVKINAIRVPAGMGTELEKRFAERARSVEQMPGFEGFELLRPTAGEERYFVYTRWDSEESFQNWVNSQSFQHGHSYEYMLHALARNDRVIDPCGGIELAGLRAGACRQAQRGGHQHLSHGAGGIHLRCRPSVHHAHGHFLAVRSHQPFEAPGVSAINSRTFAAIASGRTLGGIFVQWARSTLPARMTVE